MSTKLEIFKEKTLEQQREFLLGVLTPFKERSQVFQRTIVKVQSAKDSSLLVTIMKRMLDISANIQQRKKEEKLEQMEGYQTKLKQIHDQEVSEAEDDLESMLENELNTI